MIVRWMDGNDMPRATIHIDPAWIRSLATSAKAAVETGLLTLAEAEDAAYQAIEEDWAEHTWTELR